MTPSVPATCGVTYWHVHYCNRAGENPHTSSALHSPHVVRHHHAMRNHHLWDAWITEHTQTHTIRPLHFTDLPSTSTSPPLPNGAHYAAVHYRFNHGPAVLPSPEAVRRWHHRATRTTGHYTPDQLHLCEITVIRYARRITLSDLPDHHRSVPETVR